jgi:hypothetical protein
MHALHLAGRIVVPTAKLVTLFRSGIDLLSAPNWSYMGDDKGMKSEPKGRDSLIPSSQMDPGYGGSCWSRDFTRIVPL